MQADALSGLDQFECRVERINQYATLPIIVRRALNVPRLSPRLLSACFLWSLQADQNQESAPLPTNEYKITPVRF